MPGHARLGRAHARKQPRKRACVRARGVHHARSGALLEAVALQQAQGSDARNYDWLVDALDQLKVGALAVRTGLALG
jgi:hypothetical protein